MVTPWGMLRLAIACFAHMIVTFRCVNKYQLLVELDSDMLNHVDFCKRANKWFVPETAARAAITLYFIVFGHWIVALCALPLDAYNLYRLFTNTYKYDPTEIVARKYLSVAKRQALYEMLYQAVFFCMLFVCLLSAGVIEFTYHPAVRVALIKRMFPWVSSFV